MSHADRMIAKAVADGDEAAVCYWKRVRARVDAAPPLDASQRDRLAVLLRPAPAEAAPPATPRRAGPGHAKAA